MARSPRSGRRLSADENGRFAESTRYGRSYPKQFPVLRDLLPGIQVPVHVFASADDPLVPVSNGEYLAQRIPGSRLTILPASHFAWEEIPDQSAAPITEPVTRPRTGPASDRIGRWRDQRPHDHPARRRLRRDAPHEAEPVAARLSQIGVPASVFRYPLYTRHPWPLEALRAEISRRRADGAQRIGPRLLRLGHLAGLAAPTPGATPDQAAQFAVPGYAITSMETETYRPARLILLGEGASPDCAGRPHWTRWSRPAHHRSSSGIPQRTPTSRPNTPDRLATALAAAGGVRTPCTCSPTGPTAWAWPAVPARPSSGPRWRRPGSTNRCDHVRECLLLREHPEAGGPTRNVLHGRDYRGPRLLRPA